MSVLLKGFDSLYIYNCVLFEVAHSYDILSTGTAGYKRIMSTLGWEGMYIIRSWEHVETDLLNQVKLTAEEVNSSDASV
jgi:hypothetical protein